MPDEYSWDQYLTRRIQDQVNYIVDAYKELDVRDSSGRAGVAIAAVPDSEGGIEYMYAEGQLLARDEHLQAVLEIVDSELNRGGEPSSGQHGDGDGQQVQVERVLPGVAQIKLLQPDLRRDLPSVLPIIEEVDRRLGPGNVTPNHVLTVAPAGPCPATEPETAYYDTEPFPSVCHENSGAGIKVFVADTGLLKHAEHHHPWLQGVRRANNPDGTPQPPDPDRTADGKWIPPYSGHGTFVAAEVLCLAPGADVIVANVFQVAGSTLEADLVQQLDQALDEGVDVFNLSIACGTRAQLTVSFDGFLQRLSQDTEAVCVVAAGNNGSKVPTYPAALPGMVSVGALGSDWHGRARFSNHGDWVDVYAPGRGLVNAFASGPYECRDAPYENEVRHFHGMARWSGTSFSTPIVTGLIAARMARTGETGPEAAAALLAEAATHAIPGVGPVLLPPGARRLL